MGRTDSIVSCISVHNELYVNASLISISTRPPAQQKSWKKAKYDQKEGVGALGGWSEWCGNPIETLMGAISPKQPLTQAEKTEQLLS